MADQWDDEKIERLLQSMPKTQDRRSKKDILERLKNDERLRDQEKQSFKKRNWIPFVVSTAAIICLSILVPFLLSQEGVEIGEPSNVEKNTSEQQDRSVHEAKDQTQDNIQQKSEETTMMHQMGSPVPSNVVTASTLQNHVPFQVGLVHEANVIPVTFLIPNEQEAKDRGNAITTVERYQQLAAAIPEEALGFDDYHPYAGTLTANEKNVVHQLPPHHQYDQSAASIEIYMNTVKATFSHYDRLETIESTGKLATFDYVGEMSPIRLERKDPYFKYQINHQSYLVPYPTSLNSPSSVITALEAMKTVENDIVQSLVPEDLTYTVRVSNQIATIQFSKEVDLAVYDPVVVRQMIEGFMLTASAFNYAVQFDRVVQDQFEQYDLTQPLPIPLGANPLQLPPQMQKTLQEG